MRHERVFLLKIPTENIFPLLYTAGGRQVLANGPPNKGTTGGLSASASIATSKKTLLDKPAVAPDGQVYSSFSTGC